MSIFTEITSNPVFAMSLSSKELFHSNFWAWLFERNIAYAKVFFSGIKEIKRVEREKNHRDVTIWETETTKNKTSNFDDAYIIENKFKSIPYKEQLVRYQDAVEAPKDKNGNLKVNQIKHFCSGILTGIKKPDFIEELDNWEFLSYDEIGKRIKSVAMEVETDGFEKELIVKYSELICQLQKIILEAIQKNGNVWNTKNQSLENLRINDIYAKLVAGRFVDYLFKNLYGNIDKKIANYQLIIESYYGLNGAGSDIRYVDKKNKELTLIGVQIEGSQYRVCIQLPCSTKGNEKMRQNTFNKFIQKKWFVAYDPKADKKTIRDHLTLEERKTGMSKQYGVYDKKNTSSRKDEIYEKSYTFLYQYWTIPDDFSFEELCSIIKRDMEFAKEILLELS